MNNLLISSLLLALLVPTFSKNVQLDRSSAPKDREVSLGEKPYQVLSIEKFSKVERSPVNSAILINKKWILATSSSNVDTGATVYLGTTRWCRHKNSQYFFKYDDGKQVRTVGQVIHNREHKKQKVYFLLAELKKEVTFTDNIKPAKLATEKPHDNFFYNVSGYGFTEEFNGIAGSCKMREVLQKKLSDAQCKAVTADEPGNANEFCAGDLGTTAPYPCAMHIGSPLASGDVVYGLLTKLRAYCGGPDSPSFYLPVEPYLEWIKRRTSAAD